MYLSYLPARQDRQSLQSPPPPCAFTPAVLSAARGKRTHRCSPLISLLLAGNLDIWPIPLEGIRREMKCCLRQIDKKCPRNARDAFPSFFVRWFSMATKTPGWMNEHLSCALSPSRTKFAVWQHAAPHDQPEVTRCPTYYYSTASCGLNV